MTRGDARIRGGHGEAGQVLPRGHRHHHQPQQGPEMVSGSQLKGVGSKAKQAGGVCRYAKAAEEGTSEREAALYAGLYELQVTAPPLPSPILV